MSEKIYEVVIDDISYLFDAEGNVFPIVTFEPAIIVKKISLNKVIEDVAITRIKLHSSKNLANNEFNVGNHIRLKKVGDSKILLVPNEKDNDHNFVCPACGSSLIHTDHSVGKCINISCAGRMQQIVFTFLSALGIVCTSYQRRIIDLLLQTGGLVTLPQLWYISYEALKRYLIPDAEILKFLQILDSVKGKVDQVQLLVGLGIYKENDENAFKLRDIFLTNMSPLSHTLELYNLNHDEIAKVCDVKAMDQFLQLAMNRVVFKELCCIFDKNP